MRNKLKTASRNFRILIINSEVIYPISLNMCLTILNVWYMKWLVLEVLDNFLVFVRFPTLSAHIGTFECYKLGSYKTNA